MRGKKKIFLEALKEQLGVVTSAAKQTGISRMAHYKWMKDPEYAEEVNKIDDLVLDFAENALFKLMQDKNTAAIIFFLKCKGKKRGYIEKPEIMIDKQLNVQINQKEAQRAIEALKEYEHRIKSN